MKISHDRELKLVIAALLIDNERGDGKFTWVEALGYTKEAPVVLLAAATLHDLSDAGNDVYFLFSANIAELKNMEADGRLEMYREASKGTKEKIGRNSPCPCGSGKKYKKCCYDNERKIDKYVN